LLIAAANTAYAANDVFDASTSLLTIPSITVGTTTFTNVVVRLRAYDVLAVDPNPLPGLVYDSFLYQYKGCSIQGNQMTCNLVLTSQFQNRTKGVGNSCSGDYIQMSDDKGNVYTPSFVSIANQSNTCNQAVHNFPFVADTPVAVSFKFDNIATNATSIALLSVGKFSVKNQPFR
jgi:hypothetical protein